MAKAPPTPRTRPARSPARSVRAGRGHDGEAGAAARVSTRSVGSGALRRLSYSASWLAGEAGPDVPTARLRSAGGRLSISRGRTAVRSATAPRAEALATSRERAAVVGLGAV